MEITSFPMDKGGFESRRKSGRRKKALREEGKIGFPKYVKKTTTRSGVYVDYIYRLSFDGKHQGKKEGYNEPPRITVNHAVSPPYTDAFVYFYSHNDFLIRFDKVL